MTPRDAFADQADSCRAMGSEVTAQVCERLGNALMRDQGAVARRVLDWPGDTSGRAASVPLRLTGAIHAVILAGKAPKLAESYQTGDPTTELLLDTIAQHQDVILHWLDSAPQTNEVGRSAAIIAAASFATAHRDLPINALELGASAGLNLNFHRYALAVGDAPSDTPVTLRPEWRGVIPDHPFSVMDARGVDLRPLDPSRDGDRLLAYCWADQTERLARLRAALNVARQYPCHVDAGDAAAWLEQNLADLPDRRLTLVYHTIALQYFPTDVQDRCEAAMQRAGETAAPDRALAHFSMEADGLKNGAALHLRLWDGALREW